jgi:hypothetical protein
MFWYSFPLPKGLSLAETQRAQSFFYLRALVILAAWREAALFFISRKAAKDAKFFILSVLAILAALREVVLFLISRRAAKGAKLLGAFIHGI